jgi:hypothetical protein
MQYLLVMANATKTEFETLTDTIHSLKGDLDKYEGMPELKSVHGAIALCYRDAAKVAPDTWTGVACRDQADFWGSR